MIGSTVLIFATNNSHKVDEVRHLLCERFQIQSLKEACIDIDIPEPYNTLEENAREKSVVINTLTGGNCFSEDTGLEVNALDGEPGVRSARYAGDDATAEQNIDKLLFNMAGKSDRAARFRTVISLILDDKEYQFDGVCTGTITTHRRGSQGFGYDAIFIPEGATMTFGEMNMSEKALYSHRKKATEKCVSFLNQYYAADKD